MRVFAGIVKKYSSTQDCLNITSYTDNANKSKQKHLHSTKQLKKNSNSIITIICVSLVFNIDDYVSGK